MAMKSIVVSCRKIIENVEEIEESPEASRLAIPVSEIEITKAKVMKLLTHLMSVAKKCASRPSSLDMDSIKIAISELTKIVQVLIFQVVPRSQKNDTLVPQDARGTTKSGVTEDAPNTKVVPPRDPSRRTEESIAGLKVNKRRHLVCLSSEIFIIHPRHKAIFGKTDGSNSEGITHAIK